jgi:hypothetical protein
LQRGAQYALPNSKTKPAPVLTRNSFCISKIKKVGRKKRAKLPIFQTLIGKSRYFQVAISKSVTLVGGVNQLKPGKCFTNLDHVSQSGNGDYRKD